MTRQMAKRLDQRWRQENIDLENRKLQFYNVNFNDYNLQDTIAETLIKVRFVRKKCVTFRKANKQIILSLLMFTI